MKNSLFLLLLLIPCFIHAQKAEETLREYFLDAEYFFAREEYMDALVDYMELYNNGFKDNANINYRIGICYLKISGQKEKAIGFLSEAVKNTKGNNVEGKYKEEKAPMDAWLFLGIAYRVNYLLDKAIEAFTTYLNLLPQRDNTGREFVSNEIESCKLAKEFLQTPVKVKLVNLGDRINGSSSNYRAVLSGDGKSLFFMNELPFYDAVYFSRFEKGKWTPPVNITPQIQSDGDQYVSSVSYDGKTLFLTKEDDFNSDIWVSYLNDSLWSKSEPLKGDVNSRFWESHASISKDGKTLYFASNESKGYGAMDIYKAELGEDNTWKNPQNLGQVINTSLNEDTPFITGDGHTLYFSSQGHHGMGGYDIYKSELKPDGRWSEPENLGYPLCTTDDDLFYFPCQSGEHALLSVFEIDGYGKEDIYEVQFINGSMFDNSVEEEKIPVTQVVHRDEEEKITADTLSSDEYLIVEPEYVEIVEITEENNEILKKEVLVTPVYFEFNSFVVNEKGKKQLDKIASLMDEFSGMYLVLNGYADPVGPEDYNLKLSEKRARSAAEYLKNKGVSAERITIKGLGETNFAAINNNPDGTDNPEGRSYNRRVEFGLTGDDTDKVEVTSEKIPDHLKVR